MKDAPSALGQDRSAGAAESVPRSATRFATADLYVHWPEVRCQDTATQPGTLPQESIQPARLGCVAVEMSLLG